jgi:hypothetical protein
MARAWALSIVHLGLDRSSAVAIFCRIYSLCLALPYGELIYHDFAYNVLEVGNSRLLASLISRTHII